MPFKEVSLLKIHEHQALALLQEAGVPNAGGQVAFTVEQAVQAARELGGERFVVKAQIHAGGRGKAGGVKLAEGLSGVEQAGGKFSAKRLSPRRRGPPARSFTACWWLPPSPSHTNTISPS